MVFSWWQRRRRQRWLSEPFPIEWYEILERNVFLYRLLREPERARVRDYLRVFIREKHWEGCRGFDVTDEVKVTISALVAILVLGLPDEYFDRVLSILVYPDTYVAPHRTSLPNGIVMEGHYPTEGEAWYRGPIILSWAEVLASGRNETEGDNLVFHEFAHQLDMRNGDHVDGVPPLESAEQSRRWQQVMQQEYARLVDDADHGRPTVLDTYGATDLSEFFAVATEAFFQQPARLQRHHPDLYAILRDYYHQDPAAR